MKKAFSLSEVLLTILIIGVVTVMVIPTVITETRNLEFTAAHKRMITSIGEALRVITVEGDIKAAEDAEDFVENYLSTQLKIAHTCSNDNLRNCGIETDENKIYDVFEQRMTMPTVTSELFTARTTYLDKTTTSYGFMMSNGYAVNLFYNPNCVSDNGSSGQNVLDNVCVNIIFDINGLEGPNQVGKDIGTLTLLYPGIESKTVVVRKAYKTFRNVTFDNVASKCKEKYKDSVVPNRYEAASVAFNRKLFGSIGDGYLCTSSRTTDGKKWTVYLENGTIQQTTGAGGTALCIEK